MDIPWVIYVSYSVNDVNYEIKKSVKLKSETIKIGVIPIGQRKTFVLSAIKEGDRVTVCYEEGEIIFK